MLVVVVAMSMWNLLSNRYGKLILRKSALENWTKRAVYGLSDQLLLWLLSIYIEFFRVFPRVK